MTLSSPTPNHLNQSHLQRIRDWLKLRDVPFREVAHLPTLTSEASALARGEPLHVGAKALLLKVDREFAIFVLPADRKLDSGSVKRHLQAKKIRFATPEELETLTGLVPGSVPPFGPPILPFPLFADSGIGQRSERMAFNAGSLTDSIILLASDWERISEPVRFEFSLPQE